MRVVTLVLAAAALVAVSAGCSAERIVTTDEPRVPSPVTTTPAPLPPPSSAHLVDAFDYVAHPAGDAVYYFTTPSGRWSCAIVPRVKAGCQNTGSWQSGLGIAGEPETVPSAQGEQTSPNAVVVEREGDPRFVALAGPELILADAKVLAFNKILAVAGFRCNVQESAGVACMSETSGKGFTFSADGLVPQYTDVPADAP